METSKRSKLTADALKQFQQGVSLVFSGWVALQDAVNGGWGGLYSREKAVSIEYSVLSFFCQPKNNEPLCIFDLEDLLCDGMNSMSLMDYEGECEEVANKLMVMYEECLEGDYQSIQRLRDARPIRHVVPVSKDLHQRCSLLPSLVTWNKGTAKKQDNDVKRAKEH
uniref:Pre-rRNA-processing protein TSR2 homolog n=1 Tax=Chenopodium quinoa TaxID=63459 RepID=A0A803MXH9_CHEQI